MLCKITSVWFNKVWATEPFFILKFLKSYGEDFDNKSFSKTYNESFWILGGGVIKITSIDNQLNLGSQLNIVDANKLIKIISTYTNKIKSRT